LARLHLTVIFYWLLQQQVFQFWHQVICNWI
jgi:hypothetical protein